MALPLMAGDFSNGGFGEITSGDYNDTALVPGIPVEAFFRTGDMTPIAYLVKPLSDYFSRAFRG